MFSLVRTEYLANVAAVAKERVLVAGDALFEQETPPEAIYFVLEGEIRATRDGKEARVAKRGEAIGALSPPTIRYYEDIGLLPPPLRSSTGYRCWSSKHRSENRSTSVRLAAALIDLYSFVVLAAVVMSWMRMDPRHPLAKMVYGLTEPVLAPIRRALPLTGGLAPSRQWWHLSGCCHVSAPSVRRACGPGWAPTSQRRPARRLWRFT